jgi:hypothetical protein
VDDTPVRWHDRVLIARRSAIPGPPLVGTAVGRYLSAENEAIYTIILDSPTADGRAILDCLETDLLVLMDGGRSGSKGHPT